MAPRPASPAGANDRHRCAAGRLSRQNPAPPCYPRAMTAEIKSTSQGRTMVLTLSNPEHRNALGPEMYAAGVEALSVAEGNPEVRSVVITGEGAIFCAGGNLQR